MITAQTTVARAEGASALPPAHLGAGCAGLESASDISSARCKAWSSVCGGGAHTHVRGGRHTRAHTRSGRPSEASGAVPTMPAWKDADGGTTFCADNELGSRWGALERERRPSGEPAGGGAWQKAASPDLLLCALLMPLETGRGSPEEEQLEAEEEEALALITAACLRRREGPDGLKRSDRFPTGRTCRTGLRPPGSGQRLPLRLAAVV